MFIFSLYYYLFMSLWYLGQLLDGCLAAVFVKLDTPGKGSLLVFKNVLIQNHIATNIYVQLVVNNSFKFEQLYFYSNQGRDKKKKVNLIGPLTLVSC